MTSERIAYAGRPVGGGRKWTGKAAPRGQGARYTARLRQHNPVLAGLMEGFRPKPRMTLSQYAEHRIVLSPERAASPGPFRIGDAVYQRRMMDAVTDPNNTEIIFLTSSQVGKSSILTAAQAYYAEQEPSPQLSAFPTQIIADAFLDEQFQPMVRDAPELARLFNGGLDFPGGYITFVGANNPSQLAMRPIRVTTGDEVDRWPLSAGKEGNPSDLLRKRATTFRNRKHIFASTPLMTKTSQITAMFKASKPHFFRVVCEDCEAKQALKWSQVMFSEGKEAEAQYACEECGSLWDERTKRRVVREAEAQGGGWFSPAEATFYDGYFKPLKPTGKPIAGHVGFWINELYSPWSSMAEMAVAHTNAKNDPMKQQTFRNTREGMPWDGDVSATADAEQLMLRREPYSPKMVPQNAGLVTAAVDVQPDRLEILTTAWGIGDEQWVLEHHVINLEPALHQTWDRLKDFLTRTYQHEKTGKRLLVEAVAIDSGGTATQMVYKFCGHHQKLGRPWYAIKGVAGEGKLPWATSRVKLKDNTKLFLVGVDDAKSLVYSRYSILVPGPAYVHLHDGITNDHIAQMTAEHAVVEIDGNGFPHKVWEKPPGRRNEMLDLMVYNYAVRSSVNIDMQVRLMKLHSVEGSTLDAAAIGQLFK